MSKVFDNNLTRLEDSDSSNPKNITVLKSLRKNRDMKSIQQSLCIGLLSKHCKIIFKEPPRKAVYTLQYLAIQSIHFGQKDMIDVEEFVKRRSLERYNFDLKSGVPEKTARR